MVSKALRLNPARPFGPEAGRRQKAMDRCVFPVPTPPTNTTLAASATKRQSKTCRTASTVEVGLRLEREGVQRLQPREAGNPGCGVGCGAPGVRSPPDAPAAPANRPAPDAGGRPARPTAASATRPSTGTGSSGPRPDAGVWRSRWPSSSPPPARHTPTASARAR